MTGPIETAPDDGAGPLQFHVELRSGRAPVACHFVSLIIRANEASL
jgi:hypothetical protein